MARLTLSLLGPARIERDGRPLVVDTRKAVALLALLALSDTPSTRSGLAAMLWPEFDRSHARAALRRTLSVLKKGVGEGVLAIDRHTIALAPDADLRSDVADFRSAWRAADGLAADDPDAIAHLERAVALYRGDLLDGFGLRDSAPFDDWHWEQAEALRRELARTLERLVEAHRRSGDLERAVGYARRLLELDPLQEGVQRNLMQLLAWTGRRSEALQQYRACVRTLEQELGVAPLEETEALYRAIKENRLPAAPDIAATPVVRSRAQATPPGADRSAQATRPPIGRSAAHDALEAACRDSAERRFLFALEGEAGIGKTTLAEFFLAGIAARGAATAGARCYPGENQLAYGPFIDLLRAALRLPDALQRLSAIDSRWLVEAARLIPELGTLLPDLPPPPPLDGPIGRSHLFEGVDRVLARLLQRPAGAAVLLDDVHWADPATLELLAYLSRPERPGGLLLLVTLRPDGGESQLRVRDLVAAAERDGRGRSLGLQRWGRAEIEQLLQRSDTELSPEETERLFRESEGLPFFVSEYLSALAQRAVWDELPRGVRALLGSRLAAISDMERQLLQTAAAIGRSFDFELLRRASGRADDEIVVGLERLVGFDIVRESQGDPEGSVRFDFTHEKMRTLVYEETSLVRRRLLHGRVAAALLGAGGSGQGGAAVAGPAGFHLRLAGREREAALRYAEAGDHARSLFANPEALQHYQTALALGHHDPAALHEALGDLHTLAGAYEQAIQHFETAAALLADGGLGRLEHKLGNVHGRCGAWDTAESHYRAAAELLGAAEWRDRARLLVDRSVNAHRRGRADEALELARQALSFGERTDDASTLAAVHNLLGMLARQRGDPTEASRSLELSLALTEQSPDPSARIAALNNLALVRAESGEIDAGLALLESALTLCRRQGDRHREAALLNNSADLLHAAGRSDEAMARVKRSAAIYAAIGRVEGDWLPEIWKLESW